MICQNWLCGFAYYCPSSSDVLEGKLPRMRSAGSLPTTGGRPEPYREPVCGGQRRMGKTGGDEGVQGFFSFLK